MSEEEFNNNIYLAVPKSLGNAKFGSFLNYTAAGDTVENVTTIFKTDASKGLFCYYCWYIVTVMSNYTGGNSAYRIYISENGDKGNDIPEIRINNPTIMTLPSGIGSVG